MTDAAFLRAAGAALYGPRWQAALAADLGVTPRTVQFWLTGERPIPPNRIEQLRELLAARRDAIEALLAA